MSISSPLCRIGRKRSIRDAILDLSPNHFKIYVEPFVGSGDMYFYYNLDHNQKAYINDVDDMIYSSFKIIKDSPKITDINKYNLTLAEMQEFVDKNHTDPIDKLVKNIFILCGTFGSKAIGKLYRKGNVIKKLQKLPLYSKYMKNTVISRKDWSYLLKYDSPDTFFFIDPPYESSDQLYKNHTIDYKKMRDKLRKIKGKFLLTINKSSYIIDLFDGFNIFEIDVKGKGKKGIGEGIRKELIITNFNK